jgi:hypothetical protein
VLRFVHRSLFGALATISPYPGIHKFIMAFWPFDKRLNPE